jgi:hypothetical protein
MLVALCAPFPQSQALPPRRPRGPVRRSCALELLDPVISATGSPWFTSGIDAADLDGDGTPEVVTADSVNATFTTLRYVGSGVLQPTAVLSLTSGDARDVRLADVTGDGQLDLVGCVDFGSGALVVFPGQGDASFGTGVLFGPDMRSATQLEIADFDGDQDLDVVVSSSLGALSDPHALVFRNRGDGSFDPPDTYAFVPSVPFTYFSTVTVGDVNGDGHDDLVGTGLPFNGIVGIQLGVGDGTFLSGPSVVLAGTSMLHALALADVDRDGDLDIAVYDGDFDAPKIVLARNDGRGDFQAQRSLPLQGSVGSIEAPRALVFGRLDGDAMLDVVTSDNFIPLGRCSRPSASGLRAFDAVLVDLDGDGRLDPVLAAQVGDSVTGVVAVFLNRTTGA